MSYSYTARQSSPLDLIIYHFSNSPELLQKTFYNDVNYGLLKALDQAIPSCSADDLYKLLYVVCMLSIHKNPQMVKNHLCTLKN